MPSASLALLAFQLSAADSLATTTIPDPVAPKVQREDSLTAFERYGRWQVGVAGGSVAGAGVGLRYWLNPTNALELRGFARLSRSNLPDHETSGDQTTRNGHYFGSDSGVYVDNQVNLGLIYLHEVARIRYLEHSPVLPRQSALRVLTFLGAGMEYDLEDLDVRTRKTEYSYSSVKEWWVTLRTTDERRRWTTGAGGGAEFEVWRFSFHILAGVGGYLEESPYVYSVGMVGDAGLMFRF